VAIETSRSDGRAERANLLAALERSGGRSMSRVGAELLGSVDHTGFAARAPRHSALAPTPERGCARPRAKSDERSGG